MTSTSTDTTTEVATTEGGTWSPLRNRLFAVLLLIQLFTQLAVFMSGLAAAWAMTDITDSPALVASLQLAVTLPTFLLALLAGALADVASRKRIILFALSGNVVVAGAFVLLSGADAHTPLTLLALTASLGVFSALAAPTWLAIIPGLVPRSDLAPAMTLSSAGLSGAMAVGPAVAGLLIALTGPTFVFALNIVVFIVGIVALRTWKPAARRRRVLA